MAQAVKYKKPRLINVVSVSIALALALAAYLAYQYLPLFLQQQEARRVLEETSSGFSGRQGYYIQDAKARKKLLRKMTAELRTIGVTDPDAEIWLEVEGSEARFGVLYSKWIDWPYDIIERQEAVYEVEHVIKLRR